MDRPTPRARGSAAPHAPGCIWGAMRRDERRSDEKTGDEKTQRRDAKIRDQAGRDETKREDMLRDKTRKWEMGVCDGWRVFLWRAEGQEQGGRGQTIHPARIELATFSVLG